MVMDIEGKIGSNTVIIGDFNTPLASVIDHSDRINKETVVLNDKQDQIDLIGIFRAFPPKRRRIYILFRCT